MSNLIFRALLSGVPWETIIRRLELNERAKGVGDGKIEDHRYTIIQRGDEILVVLPDSETREKCQKMAKKLLSKILPQSEIEIATLGYASTHCNYCLELTSLPYKCYRCHGWYCRTHRLPEEHNCPNGEGKDEGAAKQIEPKREKTTEKVVVTEIPCG